jgi:hypothetical protein
MGARTVFLTSTSAISDNAAAIKAAPIFAVDMTNPTARAASTTRSLSCIVSLGLVTGAVIEHGMCHGRVRDPRLLLGVFGSEAAQ